MAVFYIAEYSALAQVGPNGAQIPDEASLITEQTVAIGAAAQSAALNPGTRFVRITCDAVCSIKFGYGTVGVAPNPQASVAVTNQRIAAGEVEYKGVPTNGNGSGTAQVQVKIAVITNT